MKAFGLIAALVLAVSAQANTNTYDAGYFEIDSVEIQDVTEIENAIGYDFMSVQDPAKSWRKKPSSPISSIPTDPISEAEVIIDRIIALGSKVWAIVEKNKPVVNTKFQALSALPQGAKRWDQLENWAMPETRVYRITYKNVYRMTVVDFAFRLAYTYGGSVEGKGQYLANIEIEPRALDVAWFYTFNAAGIVTNVHNAGTKTKPMAGVEIKMDWQINTVAKHSQQSDRFFIRGDGLFKNLSNGTLPAQ